jgi:hypothetical protein
MLIRQSFNVAVHLAAGIAFGAMVVVALRAARTARHDREGYLDCKAPRSQSMEPAPD